MAIDLYWGSGSPHCWSVQLALEFKRLSYNSHLLRFDRQDHQSPQMLAMNPRGRLPVLRDNDYVVFESLAILYYLDLKYPQWPLFGRSAEEAAVVMRVVNEFQAYTQVALVDLVQTLRRGAARKPMARLTDAMHRVANEARTIELRMARCDWIVGESPSAADFIIYPHIRLLHQALLRPGAEELSARFLPVEKHYPALAQWLRRVEDLPGFAITAAPHWEATPNPPVAETRST
jgi:glutathione S-transferase